MALKGSLLFLLALKLCAGFLDFNQLLFIKDYAIRLTWDGQLLSESDVIHFSLNETDDKSAVEIRIRAPFYNDPAPDAEPGEAFYGLWNYEVVECFFVSEKPGRNPDYLELEFGPHGQHLGLLLHGVRNAIKHSFPIEYEASIDSDQKMWTGRAIVAKKYFPPGVNKFNAFAINGPEDGRNYKALYPVPGEQADFHKLEYYLPFDGRFIDALYSGFWTDALETGGAE